MFKYMDYILNAQQFLILIVQIVHVDASVMFRKWKDANGHDREYEIIVKDASGGY